MRLILQQLFIMKVLDILLALGSPCLFVQFEDPACAYAETVITKFTKPKQTEKLHIHVPEFRSLNLRRSLQIFGRAFIPIVRINFQIFP